MFDRPTIQDVLAALKPLIGIPRPVGDNEGDPINGDTVFPYLSPKHQEQVQHAATVAYEYARTDDGEANRRALNTMTRHGFRASLDPAQYEPDHLVGRVIAGEWEIDISDPRCGSADD
ncbi:hypothetical protein LMG29542_00109 [Paraburkholderia humisilvae]|uniref:Uncharacterized protein n=2 Tax=Paraburkholderia humisilvae TaxID=627669 RepID=A0A6J5D045_9BURK|nr:hypothetical protein LMG29542_00109 [Paraburkholderia humisilvae]